MKSKKKRNCKSRPPADLFMSHVRVDEKSGCWIWTGSLHNITGYPRFVSGKHIYAHRFSHEHFNGPIPDGYYVCHKCDVPACVNPKHLFVGTAKDNMQDASHKGRIKVPRQSYASSEAHQVAKLKDRQVKEIRSSSASCKELAKKFGVGYRAVWSAKTYRSFRDVA